MSHEAERDVQNDPHIIETLLDHARWEVGHAALGAGRK